MNIQSTMPTHLLQAHIDNHCRHVPIACACMHVPIACVCMHVPITGTARKHTFMCPFLDSTGPRNDTHEIVATVCSLLFPHITIHIESLFQSLYYLLHSSVIVIKSSLVLPLTTVSCACISNRVLTNQNGCTRHVETRPAITLAICKMEREKEERIEQTIKETIGDIVCKRS